MKRITIKKAHDLSQLHGEIISAVPALAPRSIGTLPDLGEVFEPVMRLESSGQDITIELPDDADEAAVRAVVQAHSPVAKPPPPDLRALYVEFESAVQAATTLQQMKAALAKLRPVMRAVALGYRRDINGQ